MARAAFRLVFSLVVGTVAAMLFHEIPWFIKEVPGQTFVEPVSVSELALQLRVSSNDEDNLLADLIGAAREKLEVDTRRAFIARNFNLVMDQFPYWGQLDRQSIERTSQATGVFYGGGVFMRRCPVSAVTQIQYVDPSGTTKTLDPSEYSVDLVNEPIRIYPAYGLSWPITRWQNNAITITFTAGYSADSSKVPRLARQAIRLLATEWYWNREASAEDLSSYQTCVNALRWSGLPT